MSPDPHAGAAARELRATYRLQLTPEYGFSFARELVPYLAQLGVSHLYLSPTLQAQEGSTHGYDVCDPSSLSAELGGEDEFRALAAAAAEAGMGIILDVVPNHMAASDQNRYWVDPELRERFFDVDPVSGKWRRFFDIDELAGIRIESEEVFHAVSDKLLSLVDEGLVDGLRVDHPDGLADPEQYLRRLADAGVERIWVEKILGTEERLDDSWPVSGTVGYDFLNDLVALCVNPDAEAAFTALWEEVSGDPRPFGAWAIEAKIEQARGTFTAEVERLAREPGALGDVDALALALSTQPLYRSYVPVSAGPFWTRFQQTSPAVMAKGVEDTAFYRYLRLLALNEVGGEPGRFSMSVEAFHAHNAERAVRYPEALLTTMTHDAKRSADVRTRLVAVSWYPEEWAALTRRALELGGDPDDGGPDRIDRYFVLQTLFGCWPLDWDRLDAYFEKALREAKRRSNWIDPDTDYEDGVKAWARALIADGEVMGQLTALLLSAEPLAERISRAWVALKILSPGVPDIYQGDEVEYFALVDPDNRRPVDWAARRAWLESGSDPKMDLIARLLALRARRPEAFGPGSSYLPLPGPGHTVSFHRGEVEVSVGIHPTSGLEITVTEPS